MTLKLINKEDYNPTEHRLPVAFSDIVAGEGVHLYPDAGRGYACYSAKVFLKDETVRYVALHDAKAGVRGKTLSESRQGDYVKVSPIDDLSKIVIVALVP